MSKSPLALLRATYLFLGAIYDSQALRDLVGIDLSRESVSDATTLLKLRRLLLAGDLTKAMFEEINTHLHEHGLLMRAGTIVTLPLDNVVHSRCS